MEIKDVPTIEQVFALADSGNWQQVLDVWGQDAAIAKICSRFRCPETGKSFLHAAAEYGNETACRELLRLGADAGGRTSVEGYSAADIAEAAGHPVLALLLKDATETEGSLWEPPSSDGLWPSSHLWREATERRAESAFSVAYGGGVVNIPAGSRYFVDSFGRTLVGWHGTFDPPCGMDGDTMLTSAD